MTLPSRPDSDSPIGSLHSDRMEIRRLRDAVAEARDLVAQAYSDDGDNDSPGNMAFAILNHALEQSR